MKLPIRVLATLLFLLTLTALLYTTFNTHNPLHDIWTQYAVPSFIVHTFHPQPSTLPPSSSNLTKIIVMAKTASEDTTWVTTDLYDWQSAIYAVDSPPSSHPPLFPGEVDELSTPANKGHEAMAYLTYIIDNYAALPQIIAFIHPHRSGFFSAWHTDTPLHSNPDALHSLNLTHVLNQGYVNLRCNWNPGCRAQDRHNEHVTAEVWKDVFAGTSTAGVEWPGEVGQTCCAQFAVSGERVRERPRGDYEKMREWLLATELSDRKSGRVLEFLWQVIFGMGSVFCPEEEGCYCDVYGRC